MILVTGGAGFIGSALVYELNKCNIENIVIVDRLKSSNKWRNLKKLKYAEYIHSDDFFSDSVSKIRGEITFIFHLGACSSTLEKDMDYLMENNVDYSKKLYNLAEENKIPFIYASSAATYGDGKLDYSDNHEMIAKYLPLNPYAYSKQLFDEWMLKRNTFKFPWFGLKFFNVFGPNEYHKEGMRSIAHKSFGQIKETGKVKLFKSYDDGFADGEQLRDFVYVKDVTKIMVKLMKINDIPKSGIYNMGTGKARTFDDLVKAVFKSMKKKVNIEYIEMPEDIRGQYQYYTQADMQKFTTSLLSDFKFRTLEEGVEDYVVNYLQKEDNYL